MSDEHLTGEERDEKLAELAFLSEQLHKHARTNQLKVFKPYPKQQAFYAAGRQYRERLLIAGNQVGKTLGVGAEVAIHMTGQYPEDWPGRIMRKPNKWWAAGVTGEGTRDNPQRILLGQKREYGTGMIPADAIEDVQLARGAPDLLDSVTVRHITGGVSYLWFKSYEKGREKFQGETLDGGWCDEEPPIQIYTEFLTRMNVTRGPMLMTFTPLLGMSEVVRRFLRPGSDDVRRFYITMTLDDAEHYDEDQKKEIAAQYPDYEREARISGVPMLGSGRIYPLPEEAIRFRLADHQGGFPNYWRALGAVDFGTWDHPTAAVFARIDRDSDTVYIYDCYRKNREKIAVHTKAILARGGYLPIAWPHDGHKHDGNSGKPIADLWRQDGVKMLKNHATFEDKGGFSVEAGITDLLDRMQTGRLKVASHLNDWWEEWRLYHRAEGKIVKEHDDLMDATRYLIMMLRHAQLPGSGSRRAVAETTLDDYDIFA